MVLHSRVAAKRLWNYLRVAFFMMRKGLISKRKFLMDMNLLMKRGKLIRKNLGNLVFHRTSRGYGFRIKEYEFSCSNSPNPLFFRVKRRHNYFPCLSAVVEEGDETPRPAFVAPRIEYSPSPCSVLSGELASGVSNYSSDQDTAEGFDPREVDDKAEDFIQRFYEQLRVQTRIALIEYQETEYREMLARGC